MKKFLLTIVVSIVSLSILFGCSENEENNSASANQQPLILPISLNEIMVALVNQSADPIWVASWRNPQNDQEWRNLEYLGYQLEVAGSLLTIPGTGPYDKQWTANPQWTVYAAQLKESGILARQAAEKKDLVLLNAAGDRIVEVCESCHKEFKLALPTGGLFGELSPTPQ